MKQNWTDLRHTCTALLHCKQSLIRCGPWQRGKPLLYIYISIQPTYPAHDEVITLSLPHPSPKYFSFPDTNPQWKNPKLKSLCSSHRPVQTPWENTTTQVLRAATPERILQTLNALTAMLRYCCTLTSLTTQTSNLVVLLGFLFRHVLFCFLC